MKHLMGIAVLSGLMCGGAMAQNRIDQIRPDAPALAAHGEAAIGVRTLEVSNPDQIDIVKIEAAAAL